ncbi:FAD-dependent monooxygenase [soil metagenome]
MKVLISGGGIAGLTLAHGLRRHGHDPVVVERSPKVRDEGYMIDFLGPGYDTSERMGMLSELEGIHYQIPRLAFVDAVGKEKFSISYAALRKDVFGGRHFNFMRGDLERLLYSRIEGRVPVRFGTEVEALEQDEAQVDVRFSDGSTGSFDVVIGADGIHSRVRELAFGEESRFSRPLGYYTAAFVLDDPEMRRRFGDAFYTLNVPGRQVGVYPIRGGRLATLFLFKAQRRPADFSTEAARRELETVYGGMHWIVPRLLERSTHGQVYFDEVAQIEMPSWNVGRVALVGDACQSVSLFAGQGASMAVAGAYLLAEKLVAVRDHKDITAALARYEQSLKPDIQKRQKSGRRLARWFVPDSRIRLVLQEAVWRLATRPPASLILRRQFVAGNRGKVVGA